MTDDASKPADDRFAEDKRLLTLNAAMILRRVDRRTMGLMLERYGAQPVGYTHIGAPMYRYLDCVNAPRLPRGRPLKVPPLRPDGSDPVADWPRRRATDLPLETDEDDDAPPVDMPRRRATDVPLEPPRRRATDVPSRADDTDPALPPRRRSTDKDG